jgi:outer membrane biosynthesis protein TonB
MRMKWPVIALLGGTLLLAGCKRQHEEQPVENTPAEAPRPVVAPTPAPPPVEKPKPVAAPKPKPLPATPEDQQVLDDADATGMTARVDRSGNADAQAATNREQ